MYPIIPPHSVARCPRHHNTPLSTCACRNNYHYPQLQKIAQAPPGEGCPRCGGRVYQAEEMLAMGKVRCPDPGGDDAEEGVPTSM